jgi:hypothetical protein
MESQLQDSDLIEFSKIVEVTSTEVLEGLHRSLRGGEGIEFHSSLPYMDGEDARRVDWKRFAATDRLYVNRFEREEKTSWTFLIDSSKSMSYGEKTRWASYWVGSLIFLAKVWGDRWRILPEESLPFEEAMRRLAHGEIGVNQPEQFDFEVRPTERLVVLSDFFWERERLESSLRKWKEHCSHLYLIQILENREIDFDFSGVLEFRDLESPDRLILDSEKMAKLYRSTLKQLQEDLQSCLEEGSFSMTAKVESGSLKEQLVSFFERV